MILKKDVSYRGITTDCVEGRTDRLEQGYQWDSWFLFNINTNVIDANISKHA